ncbi:MAG: hypothetical protein WA058_03010 [Minisyncoccia bacterium]
MKDLSPIEAGRWMDAAPQIVQDAVTSPATQQVLDELGRRYSLHIDVVGLLVKLTSYMLLGYAKPEDSLQELRTAGISETQARQIIDDINKRIFVPLRERVRVMTTPIQPPRPQPPRPVTAPVPSYIPPRPAVVSGAGGLRPTAAPSTGETKPQYFHLQNKIPAPARPTPSPTAASALNTPVPPLPAQPSRPVFVQTVPKTEEKPSTLAQAIGNALKEESKVPQQTPMPQRPPGFNSAPLPPKMAMPRFFSAASKPIEDSNRMLEDHEEPHINFPPLPKPTETTPRLAAPIAPMMSRPVPAPINLPGAMPPIPVPEPVVPKAETAPMPPQPAPTPFTPVVAAPAAPAAAKPSSDPYREPIE